jgi:type I restriction enzyme S subunit
MNAGRDLVHTKETITDLAIRECRCRPARAGSVLLSFKLSIGKVGIAQVPIYTNEAIAALPIKDPTRIEAPYLYWALKSVDLTLGLDRAAKGLTLNTDKLLRIGVPVPSVIEQRRIAGVLDRADALRAKRRAALAQLDVLTQSIFLDTFGDPDDNPKRWPLSPVADYVVAFQGGKSVDPESGMNPLARYRVLKISAVTGMRFLPGESKPVPASYEPPSSHFVRRGDLLFSRANTSDLVGAVAIVEDVPDNLLLPDKLWRFVWRQPPSVEPRFVWALFQSRAVRAEISRRATGTSGSMKNISQEKVLAIETILPPLQLQREFVRRAGSVDHLRAISAASSAELDALLASLQQRAFAGEL